MKRSCCWTILLMAVTGALAQSETRMPEPADYAWGFPIAAEPSASFIEAELPLLFYQSVSDSALRDAGVFNAAGVPVPRLFRSAREDVSETEQTRTLSAIALDDRSPESADAVRLRFEREGDRTTVQFDSDGVSQPPASDRPGAYLLDARPIRHPLDTISLHWQDTETGFIGQVAVEGSNDLENWHAVGSGAIADLRQASVVIVQREIRLRRQRYEFLRLTGADLPSDWRLATVEGRYAATTVRRERQSTVLAPRPDRDPDDGGYIYDLGGAPPVDRLRVVLDDDNTILTGILYYWLPGTEQWVQVAAGPHYRVGRGGNVVTSPETRIDARRAARFKLAVIRGQPGTAPRLELRWRSESVLFLAQGQGPFLLAAGRSLDAADDFPLQRQFADPAIASLASQGRVTRGSVGPRQALGGATDLSRRLPLDWRRLTLWIGLTLGVAFVGFLAMRVLRDNER